MNTRPRARRRHSPDSRDGARRYGRPVNRRRLFLEGIDEVGVSLGDALDGMDSGED